MKLTRLVFFNIIVLAIGLSFVILSHNHDVIKWVIRITGGGFILLAAINAVMLTSAKSSEIKEIQAEEKAESAKPAKKSDKKAQPEKPRRSSFSLAIGWICSIGAAVLGILMLALPDLFRPLLYYLFALLTFLGGCYQIWLMAKAMKPVAVPGWFYAMPVAMIVLAVVMIMMPSLQLTENQPTAVLIYGIGYILFAATSFLNIIYFKANIKKALNPEPEKEPEKDPEKPAEEANKVEDVEAKEVKPENEPKQEKAAAPAAAPETKDPDDYGFNDRFAE